MEKKELLETVASLVEQINAGGLEEIEVETEAFRVKIRKRCTPPAPLPISTVPFQAAPLTVNNAAVINNKTEEKDGNLIRSPIIGTFYASAAPGKPPFIVVGSKVSKGMVVCIVESMKLMNEITSDYDGTVTEILVEDGQPVEYDQPIIRIG